MVATTDFVGTRVFSNLSGNLAKIDTRDSTVISTACPAPLADNARYPVGELARISTSNPEDVTKLGAGILQDAVNQIASEGIDCDIAFVRTQHSVKTDPTEKFEEELNAIVGSAGAKTGVWRLLNAESDLKIEPGLIMLPGYDSQRVSGAANPAVVAASSVAEKIIDCMVVANTPVTSREDAAAYAEDHKTRLNVIAMYPQAIVNLGAGNITRPLSPHVVAAIVRRDKETGGPYKASWNRALRGILGTSLPVQYTNGEITSDANYLVQRGVGTVIEGNLLWNPFTTATDPTTIGWRSVKRIRTRKAIDKALLKPFREYLSEDLGPASVSLIFRSADQHFMDLVTMGALIDYRLFWSKSMNPATLLEAGALRAKLTFAETPDLVDLQLYTEPQPEAYDLLGENIGAALGQLGLPNISVIA